MAISASISVCEVGTNFLGGRAINSVTLDAVVKKVVHWLMLSPWNQAVGQVRAPYHS
jgi:hypothetical protein